MTLHWWMHWFWVTTLLIIIVSSGWTTAAPQSEDTSHVTTDVEVDHRHTDRQGRAMYFPKVQTTKTIPVINTTEGDQSDLEVIPKAIIVPNVTVTEASIINVTEIDHPSIQWTAVNVTDDESNVTVTETPKNVTNSNVTATVTYTNLTDSRNATFTAKKKNLTRLDFVKDDGNLEGVSESRIVTEKPLSLETTYNLQTRIPPNLESYRKVVDGGDGMDTGAIAGISFAALVLAALAGSTAFVLYRRRYLNKPQTLNDKCSNPDSSGYLDDSTVRDNSEEMYSLDNDSFLNSLEAMTIQNYWTDTVKHTKL